MHGRGRRKASDYTVRLMEEQRLRHQYNVSEKQLRAAFDAAVKADGKPGEILVRLLECRLDRVVYRSGLARSVCQARQLVAHGHFTVDSSKVDRPSYRLKPGQVVAVHERSRTKPPFQLAGARGGVLLAPATVRSGQKSVTARPGARRGQTLAWGRPSDWPAIAVSTVRTAVSASTPWSRTSPRS
jgi:small subunit ribosomal protein S4